MTTCEHIEQGIQQPSRQRGNLPWLTDPRQDHLSEAPSGPFKALYSPSPDYSSAFDHMFTQGIGANNW